MHKRIYIDVETTGTEPEANGIVQLSGMVEIDGKEMERFNHRIKPFPTDVINPASLAVSGNTEESIKGFNDPQVVYNSFVSMVLGHVDKYDKRNKFHFIGYNAKFDSDFVRAWFAKNGDKYYGSLFWNPAIDVMNMAAVRLMEIRPEMENFKLMTVAKQWGINVDESRLHDAMYDIEITKKLFDILSQ